MTFGHLFMVELFSHADCWYYLSCHRLDCDLGHWVSPGAITEGIHWFHLAFPPAGQRQGCSRSHWEPSETSVGAKQGFAKLAAFSQIMTERTTTSGPSEGTQVPKHQTSEHRLLGATNKWDVQPLVRHLCCTMVREVPVRRTGHPYLQQ